MDMKNSGQRVRAKRMIRSFAGIIPPRSHGTIRYEIETLGRQLIMVEWDAGPSTYAFADEIEILGGNLFMCQSLVDSRI
ncbi:MAG TPA: hypothetical protein VEG60_29415 [Candidatus Binatia bacterium]|nr:hypothetical protein [Candidatus Binatia bacterium]